MTAATNILLRLLQTLRDAAARRRALPRGTSEYETALREEREAMRELFREAGEAAPSEERKRGATDRVTRRGPVRPRTHRTSA